MRWLLVLAGVVRVPGGDALHPGGCCVYGYADLTCAQGTCLLLTFRWGHTGLKCSAEPGGTRVGIWSCPLPEPVPVVDCCAVVAFAVGCTAKTAVSAALAGGVDSLRPLFLFLPQRLLSECSWGQCGCCSSLWVSQVWCLCHGGCCSYLPAVSTVIDLSNEQWQWQSFAHFSIN